MVGSLGWVDEGGGKDRNCGDKREGRVEEEKGGTGRVRIRGK
jgi:hypothetical protein